MTRIAQIDGRLIWVATLAAMLAALVAVTMAANSIKGDVKRLERSIIAAERHKLLLETELQARASQRQLAEWNAIEFGFTAPRSNQFIDNHMKLAAFSDHPPIGHPEPIRLVRAESGEHGGQGIPDTVRAFAGLPIEETHIAIERAAALMAAATTPGVAPSPPARASVARWAASPTENQRHALSHRFDGLIE